MSINISTTEYTETRKAVIDGVEFEVRPMNSSETISLTLISQDFDDGTKEHDATQTKKAIEDVEKLFFGLFDKPKEARKIMHNLSIDAMFDIYNKIMEGESK